MSELYHYGVIGQKWGVRNYQNPDGSLTEAGRKRYNDYQKNNAREVRSLVSSRISGDAWVAPGYGKYRQGSSVSRSTVMRDAAKAISSTAKKKEIEQIKERDKKITEAYKQITSIKNTFRLGKQSRDRGEYVRLKEEQIKQISDIMKRSGISDDLMGKYKNEKVLGITREKHLTNLMAEYADMIWSDNPESYKYRW